MPGQPPYPGQPGQPLYSGQPTYPGQPLYSGQPPYPGQPPVSGQPPEPGQPPVPFAAPPVGAPFAQPVPFGTDPNQPAPIEKVGVGLALSGVGVLAGIVLTVVIWQFGFIASITSFAMAWACVWLYTRGAGAPPKRGVPGLIAIILGGAVLSMICAIGSDAVAYSMTVYPGTPVGDLIGYGLQYGTNFSVWAEYGFNIFLFFLFAGLGIFSTLRGLGQARRA